MVIRSFEISPFKMHFDLFLYDFRFPRYYRKKKSYHFFSFNRISRLHFTSLTYIKLEMNNDKQFLENLVSKEKYRLFSRVSSHNLYIVSSTMITLNDYIVIDEAKKSFNGIYKTCSV